MSNKRAALYVRVSTDAQTVENSAVSFGKSRSGVAGK
jgi:DNA invertase Pin-like site-specific DNA recombinase